MKHKPILMKKQKELLTKDASMPLTSKNRNKLVLFLNLSSRAGATFITVNFASYLSSKGILPCVIELPYTLPYIFDLVGLDYKLDSLKDDNSYNYNSFAHSIVNRDNRMDENIIDNISWAAIDPRRSIINPNSWTDVENLKMLQVSKLADISLIDCGSYLPEFFLPYMDKLFVIIDPLPVECMNSKSMFDRLKKLIAKGFSIEFIVNRWNDGVKLKELLTFFDISPIVYIPAVDANLVYEASYSCKVPYEYKSVKRLVDRSFNDIFKSIFN